jgi:hypothetical protein
MLEVGVSLEMTATVQNNFMEFDIITIRWGSAFKFLLLLVT